MIRLAIPAAALLLSIAIQPASADETSQIQSMLKFFSASCSTRGPWSQAATAETFALAEILKSVQNDPDCVGLSGAIGSLNQLQQQISYLQGNGIDGSILSMKMKEQELLLQYSQATDPTERSVIRDELRAKQLSIAGYYASSDPEQEIKDSERARAMGTVVTQSSVLLNQAIANQSCLVKKPGLLTGFASLGASVASAFVSPGASLGLTAGVQLMGAMIEYSRKMNVAKKIDKLVSAVADDAYQCALESLSNHWCSENDAKNIINLKIESLLTPVQTTDPLSASITLSNRDLPVLLTWLDSVRAGSPATNIAEGERKEEVKKRETKVQNALIVGLAVIAENEDGFNSLPEKDKWIVEKNVIQKILEKLNIGTNSNGSYYSDGSTNPLSEINSPKFSPYFLLGLTLAQTPRPNGSIADFSSFDPFTQWQGSGVFTASLDVVTAQLKNWVTQAQSLVSQERNRIFQPDSLKILTEAVEPINRAHFGNLTPLQSMKNISEYLRKQHPQSFDYDLHRQIYEDTLKRFDSMIEKVQAALAPCPVGTSCTRPDPTSVMSEIYKQAELGNGTILLKERLESSLRLAIWDLIDHDPSVDPALAAQLMAVQDVVADLKQYTGGNLGLVEMKTDIEHAQSNTEGNISSFAEFFSKNIRTTLDGYSRKAQDAGEGIEGKNSKARAQLCLKLLASPSWPKDVKWQSCVDTKLPYDLAPKLQPLTITTETFSLPLEKRACLYRNFLRTSRILEARLGG